MSWLYQAAKFTGRVGLPLYFGRLEINGKEHIPADRPFLFAPNHQNAFLDALIVGILTKKPVHFLTRSDVFVPPYIPALEALNMLPVYRIRDGYDKLKKNDETFELCYRLLADKKPVLIFPEGNMGPGHHIRPLTKGTARMAFQAQEVLSDNLCIVPVGINYFHHDHPRHKLILNFGEPIEVTPYQDNYKENKAKALIKLRDDISQAIKDLLIIPEKDDLYEERKKIFGRQYEKGSFAELKRKVESPEHLSQETYHSSLLPITWLLSIPNLPPLLLIKKVIGGLREKQFIGSLTYILSLFGFPSWWLILGLGIGIFVSWPIAMISVLVAITSLFVREEIMKWVR